MWRAHRDRSPDKNFDVVTMWNLIEHVRARFVISRERTTF